MAKKLIKNENNVEVRAIEGYLRGEDSAETRSLSKSEFGGALVPEQVAEEVVKKLEEVSPLFEMARRFESVQGNLRVPKETAFSGNPGFVGEIVELPEINVVLDTVELKQKRVGAHMVLTKQLMLDAAVDITGYSTDVLTRRVGKTIETAMLIGTTASGSFEGVLSNGEIVEVELDEIEMADSFIDMYTTLHPDYLAGAAFIMDRSTFNKVAKLKDDTGAYLVVRDFVNEAPSYKLLGCPLFVTDTNTNGKVLFGSFKDGYALMLKQGLNLQLIAADTNNALRGTNTVILDGFMDGAVINTEAFVIGTLVV